MSRALQVRSCTYSYVNTFSLGLFACPFVGPYCISKFAAEAISRTLRMELHPLGLPVITIQPGVYK